MYGVINIRQYAASICDVFEDILERNNINIPDEDREGDDGEARIYGLTYGELEDKVKDIIEQVLIERDQYDDYEIERYNY